MFSILVIYKGWKIAKGSKGYRVISEIDGRPIYLSSILKTLSDAFMFCDSVDYAIAYRKVERGCNT